MAEQVSVYYEYQKNDWAGLTLYLDELILYPERVNLLQYKHENPKTGHLLLKFVDILNENSIKALEDLCKQLKGRRTKLRLKDEQDYNIETQISEFTTEYAYITGNDRITLCVMVPSKTSFTEALMLCKQI